MKSLQTVLFSISILLILLSTTSIQKNLKSEQKTELQAESDMQDGIQQNNIKNEETEQEITNQIETNKIKSGSSHSSSSRSSSRSSSSKSSGSSSSKSSSSSSKSSSSSSKSSSSSTKSSSTSSSSSSRSSSSSSPSTSSSSSSSSKSTTTGSSSSSSSSPSTSQSSSSSSKSTTTGSSSQSSSSSKSNTKSSSSSSSTSKGTVKVTKTKIKISHDHYYYTDRYYDPYYSNYYYNNYTGYYGQSQVNQTAEEIRQKKQMLSNNDMNISTYLNISDNATTSQILQNLQNISVLTNSSTSGGMTAHMQKKVNKKFSDLFRQMAEENSTDWNQTIKAIQTQRQILRAQRNISREAQGTTEELLDSQQSMIRADREGRNLVLEFVNSTNQTVFFSDIDAQAQLIKKSDVNSLTNNDTISFTFSQAGASGNFFQCFMTKDALNNGIIGNETNVKFVYSVVDVNDYYSLDNLNKPVSHIYTMSAKYENNSDLSVEGLNENQTVSIYIEVDDAIDCNYVFGYYIKSDGDEVSQSNVWVEPNSTINENGKKSCILHTTHFSEFGLMLFSELMKIKLLIIFLAMVFAYFMI